MVARSIRLNISVDSRNQTAGRITSHDVGIYALRKPVILRE
jgi:hypothetical protein